MTSCEIDFTSTPAEGRTILKVSGAVDIDTSRALRHQLMALIGHGPPHIEVDLSGVNYIDSIGVSELLTASRSLARHERHLWVTGARAQVRLVFNALRLGHLLHGA